MEAILEKAAVIEVGSFHTKVGFAGEPGPRHIIRSPAWVSTAEAVQGVSGTACQKFLRRIFYNLLQVNPTDTPVFLVEGVLTTDTTRDALMDALLAKLSVPSVTPIPHPVAAVHATGMDSGIVLDVGQQDTCCIAVVDGAPLYHTTTVSRAAAATVDAVIKECNPDVPASCVQDAKAMLSRVSATPTTAPPQQQAQADEHPEDSVTLHGHLVSSVPEVVNAPEVLFCCGESDPIPELVLNTLLKAPPQLRPSLALHIVLCGGGCMLPGFETRLLHELTQLVNTERYSALSDMTNPRARQTFASYAAVFEPNVIGWSGASILASVKGIQWLSCGRISSDRYMAARRDKHTVPRCVMPAWNDLHHVLGDETAPVSSTAHKTTRWQVQ